MALSIQIVIAAGVVLGGLALVAIGVQVHRLRNFLETEALKVAVVSMAPPFGSSHSPMTGPLGSPHGYAIYVYRQGQWVLEADLSATGCEPASPGLPGSYEGQVVKKESQPVRTP